MDARAEQRRKDREILLEFLSTPRTVREMCKHLERSKVTVYRHLRELRAALTVREAMFSRHQKNQAWVTYQLR